MTIFDVFVAVFLVVMAGLIGGFLVLALANHRGLAADPALVVPPL